MFVGCNWRSTPQRAQAYSQKPGFRLTGMVGFLRPGMEVWLDVSVEFYINLKVPTTHQRVLIGIVYENLGYGASLGFATIATNNGHDGDTGKEFTNSEILADFTNRSIHVAAVVGKRLTEVYYKHEAQHSYYFGCSTGGRQGIYSAIHYPNDFDGILAGAPATNFNAGISWAGMVARYLGAPHPESSANFIPIELWKVIHEEVLEQCDTLDGVKDGIITEPDVCEFRPEELLCTDGESAAGCLTVPQVETLRKIYGPLYGLDGEFLSPGLTPGAELPGIAYRSGKVPQYTEVCPFLPAKICVFLCVISHVCFLSFKEWMKYVVRNETLDFSIFDLEDVKRILDADPGEISTYSGDLAAFHARGGKVVSYHGQMDDVSFSRLVFLPSSTQFFFSSFGVVFFSSSSHRLIPKNTITSSHVNSVYGLQAWTTSTGSFSFLVCNIVLAGRGLFGLVNGRIRSPGTGTGTGILVSLFLRRGEGRTISCWRWWIG